MSSSKEPITRWNLKVPLGLDSSDDGPGMAAQLEGELPLPVFFALIKSRLPSCDMQGLES